MGLANFLGKTALGASQVLKDFDFANFQQLLLSHNIRICFDKKTIQSREGFATADLLVRLLARLYPNLHLQCVDGKASELEHLNELALAINPFVDLMAAEPTTAVVIGDTSVNLNCQTFFIGSDQWLSKFSLSKPQLSGDSVNRFGAGAAACFAAANIFRHVFSNQLPASEMDQDFIYSCFNGCINEETEQGPAINNVMLEDTVLVGLGAIGNGAVWTLRGLPLSGSLHIIDGQRIDLSNLQRYVLATQDDIGHSKTEIIGAFLNSPVTQLYPYHFDEYISRRSNWDIFRVAVCVDSARDRRLVQGSLPKRIINAWTQPEQCGVSRHYNFLDDPCVICLYPGKKEEKSLSLKIAESLGFTHPHLQNMIRQYMANGTSVDAPLINLIAQINQVDIRELAPYIGKSLEIFYSEVVCGGVMMRLTGGQQKGAAEVPSVFESSMAGIMLAAELVIDCGQLRKQKPYTIQKLNLLRPITRYTYDMVNKANAEGCICHDPIFKERYSEKWKKKVLIPSRTDKDLEVSLTNPEFKKVVTP